MPQPFRSFSIAVLASGLAGWADAQEVAESAALSAICTDRPTKSNYACTVEAGHFQYESDVVNGSYLRKDGVTTYDWAVLNPTLKYGVGAAVDLEANLSPQEIVTTRSEEGPSHTVEGVGDLYLRVKYEFLKEFDGALQTAMVPYLKLPTARDGIGNGAVEGGVLMPVNYRLNDTLTLTTVPEFDSFKDVSAGGYHFNTAQLLTLGASLPRNFDVYGELWGDWNFDPSGLVRQFSADAALTYGATRYLQFDTGINIGLNRQTPAVQAYVGVSQKF